MNTQQIYIELVNLRNQAGTNIYQRLKLADQLLSDRDWVCRPDGGGGDESRAIDRLEDDCFGDLCGALSLPQMLEVMHATPDEKVWKQNKYNLRKMWQNMKDAQAASRPTSRPQGEVPLPPDPMKVLRNENKELRKEIKVLKEENRKLRKALKRVREDIRELHNLEV